MVLLVVVVYRATCVWFVNELIKCELMDRLQRYAVFSVSVLLKLLGFENKLLVCRNVTDQC